MIDLTEMKKAHMALQHFSWTNCPWCWAERQIREMLSAPMVSSVVFLLLYLCLPPLVEAKMEIGDGPPGNVTAEEIWADQKAKHKQVVIPYDDFLVMLSKVEHKDKLLNQCAAERGILIKLNDENGTIKKLNLQQIEALEGEAEAHRKLGETQEQIVRAMEQQVSGITGELTHEKRLSRYKSEFVGIGAVILGILWVVN